MKNLIFGIVISFLIYHAGNPKFFIVETYDEDGDYDISKTGAAVPTFECFCGLAKTNMSNKDYILDGSIPERYKYPWMAKIIVYNNSQDLPGNCGGSLISNKWVLSAAHCFRGVSNISTIKVFLRAHNLGSFTYSIDYNNTEVYWVEEVLLHPDYEDNQKIDLALLKLNKTVDFARFKDIRPICLPPRKSTKMFAGEDAIAAGWGRNDSNQQIGELSSILLEKDVKVVTNDQCLDKRLTKWNICTTYGVCKGDSGGPLITSGSGDGVTPGQNYELIGVAMAVEMTEVGNPACYGEERSPSDLYVRVTLHLDWIYDNAIDGFKTCPRSNGRRRP